MTPVYGQVLLDTSVVIDYPAAAVAAHAETAAEKISVQLLDSAAHEMAYHDTRLEPGTQIEFESELVLEVVEVDHPDVHLKIADQFYRGVFGALQLVWTDDERHWPWDRGWSNARRQQPVFGARDPKRLNSV